MGREHESEPIPVLSAGFTLGEIDGTKMPLPTVALDVADRPDVADLARVHATDGFGDVRTLAALLADGSMRIDVALSSPVSCAFSIVLAMPDHELLLRIAAEVGSLVFATSDPDGIADGESWLAVDMDGSALLAVLDNEPSAPSNN